MSISIKTKPLKKKRKSQCDAWSLPVAGQHAWRPGALYQDAASGAWHGLIVPSTPLSLPHSLLHAQSQALSLSQACCWEPSRTPSPDTGSFHYVRARKRPFTGNYSSSFWGELTRISGSVPPKCSYTYIPFLVIFLTVNHFWGLKAEAVLPGDTGLGGSGTPHSPSHLLKGSLRSSFPCAQ